MKPRLLMEVSSTFFGSGQPTSLRIFENGVQFRQIHSPVQITNRHLGYFEIARVTIDRGWLFSKLIVETRSEDELTAAGLSHRAARKAAKLIEQQKFEEELGRGYGQRSS